MKNSKAKNPSKPPAASDPEVKLGLLTRWGLAVSQRSRLFIILVLALAVISGLVYSRLIDREGFPQINIPINFVTVNYFVDDAARVDADLSQPLSQALKGVDGVKLVEVTAQPNGLVGIVTFVEGFDADRGPDLISRQLETVNWPPQIEPQIISIQVATYMGRYDAVLAFYQPEGEATPSQLQAVADQASNLIAGWSEIKTAEVVPLEVVDVLQPGRVQQISFNQMGLADDGAVNFYDNIFVGVVYDREQIDTLGLSALLNDNLDQLGLVDDQGHHYQATIAGDFAAPVNRQINSLQNNLLTGLVVIALVSLLLISWRSAPITALFMVSVVLLTIGILYLFGLNLNTIVLFSLVLVLGLFVDDATIVVEAIEARKSRGGGWWAILKDSLGRVTSASWAGTLTTALVFVPLLFISGLIGDIVIYMPATIIVALLVSFLLSITLIPALSRHLIITKKQKLGWFDKINPFSSLIQILARAAGWLPAQLIGPHRKRAIGGLAAILVFGLVFIFGTASWGGSLKTNIFPPARDGDVLTYSLEFPSDYDLVKAEVATESVQELVVATVGAENIDSVYYGLLEQPADQNQAGAIVNLIPYQQRSLTSSTMVDRLELALEKHLAESGVNFQLGSDGGGPPAEEFPFGVLVLDENPSRAAALANEVEDYLTNYQAGSDDSLGIIDSRIGPQEGILRRDGQRALQVSFKFDDDNVTTVVNAAQTAVSDRFTDEYLAAAGFSADSIKFDLGQEQEFADSFKGLTLGFPLVILTIFILLAFQFRSFTKPFMMLLAIPLALPGVIIFLVVTDTPLSFFVMLGLIGLVGITVNNTILLTEYINQQRRAGLSPAEAVSTAVIERFRPLIATTLTTLVALIPLIINEPFWETLAGVIVSGLVSSTLLIIFLFPSFYLGLGWLWRRIRLFWSDS